jgi:hypothetical protein
LIKACIEIGCGGLGLLVALGGEVALGRSDGVEGEVVGVAATVGVGAEASGAVAGSVALQATSTMAAGSIQNAFTQPVSLHFRPVISL